MMAVVIKCKSSACFAVVNLEMTVNWKTSGLANSITFDKKTRSIEAGHLVWQENNIDNTI